jgi:RNA polymerase sigma-70 factor, ECF subfamily
MPSKQIIKKFSEGDEVAYKEIYYHYYNYVFQFARRYIKQRDKVEDVLADVFTSLWIHRRLHENKDDLKGYLTVCVRNKCYNILRDNKRRENWEKKAEDYYKGTEVDPDKTFKILKKDETLAFIYNIAEGLKNDYKKVFFLYYSDGESAVAIARHFNVARQTIIYRLKQSRIFIKDEIKKLPYKVVSEYYK